MKKLLSIYCLCWSLSLLSQSYVLSNQTHFDHLSIKDGLPANSANAIIQTEDGYIWIGSFGGLSRYDGYEFKNYQNNPDQPANSLVGNYVRALYEDKDGYIWIGTMLNGLQRFDPRTETFTTYDVGPSSVIDKYITAITGDSLGNIWVGTTNGLFNLSSPSGNFTTADISVTHYSSKPYPDTLLQFLQESIPSNHLTVYLSKIERNQRSSKAFSLAKKTTLTLVAMGEYGEQDTLVDYGWITNNTGAVVWEMSHKDTYTAPSIYGRSDHPSNRITAQTISLEAGEYTLHYRSNDRHHNDNWKLASLPEPFNMSDGAIPAFADLWGIHLFNFDTLKQNWVDSIFTSLKLANYLSGSTILDLYVDEQQKLWIATSGGLDQLDINKKRQNSQQGQANFIKNLSTTSDFINSIYPRKNGEIWIYGHQLNGTRKSYELVIETFPRASASNSNTIFKNPQLHHTGELLEDNQGNIWLTSYKKGLYQLKQSSNESYRLVLYPFPTGNADHLFKDRSGVLWIGVWKEGIYQLKPSATAFNFTATPKEKQTLVTALVEDQNGQIFIGTDNQGLFMWDTSGQLQAKPHPANPIGSNLINDLCVDKNNLLWIATSGSGLFLYDPTTNKYLRHFPRKKDIGDFMDHLILAVHSDKTGTIWVSSNKGVYSYVHKTDRFMFYPKLSENLIEGADNIIEAKDGTMWFTGRLQGLFNIEGGLNFTFSKDPTPSTYFEKENIYNILDAQDSLWLGKRNGLQLINKKNGKKIPVIGQENIPPIRVLNILSDSLGSLWLGTDQGIGKYTLSTGTFTLFGAESGIYLDEHQSGPSLLTSSGEVLVGGKNGFYHFHPLDVTSNKLLPQIKITKFAVQTTGEPKENQTILEEWDLQQPIQLAYHQNTFEIEYVGLLYDKPKEKKYAYRILGLNNQWIEVQKERIVRFNSLPPNLYTFQVKASNGDGIWNEQVAQLEIEILPPWWKTNLAYLGYLLSFIGVIFTINQGQIRRVKLHNQLIYEQKEAERLAAIDRMKSNFFANISHELRTPLTLILAPISSVLKNDQLLNRDFTLLKKAEQSGQDLLKLIGTILDLSKLEATKMQLQETPILLFPLTRRIAASFESHVQQLNIRYTFNYLAAKDLQIEIDKKKFEIILNNLLSNAIKFTGEGGKISLEVADLITSIQLTVSDTGRGIHPDDLPHIFERFYQTRQPNMPAEGGTGIGLALCREFATLMGGSISVESELGRGSTFTVTIQKKEVLGIVPEEAQLEQDTKQQRPEIPSETNNPIKTWAILEADRNKPFILVVEDNYSLRDYLKTILSPYYAVLAAKNGLEALDIMSSFFHQPPVIYKLPDLILSDIMMPTMDGFQLLNVLKEKEYFRPIPVIMLTARANIQDKLKALRIGVDDYLLKPFEEEELLVRIETLLTNLQERKAFLPTPPPPPIPTENPQPVISKEQAYWLEEVETIIRKNIANDLFTIPELAHQLAMSERNLQRQLKKLLGLTPLQFVQEIKLTEARTLLENKRYSSIAKVAYSVGFSDPKSFSRRFKQRFGKSPSAYLE